MRPTDLIFFCNPNNPTGAAASREQLTELVAFARKNGSIIIYDAAYAIYISDPDRPQSIFEIPGAPVCCVPVTPFRRYGSAASAARHAARIRHPRRPCRQADRQMSACSAMQACWAAHGRAYSLGYPSLQGPSTVQQCVACSDTFLGRQRRAWVTKAK